MNDTWRVIILAVVQGITEFLPISSDGHLTVVNHLLKRGQTSPHEGESLTLFLALHLGTLGSIAVVYFDRLRRMVIHMEWRVIGLILLASIPAAVIGIGFKKKFEEMFESPLIAGCGFLITAVILLIGHRFTSGRFTERDMPWLVSLVVGFFQALAILPGVSRSGLTISGGTICGLDREAAATFSFLMAIPVIAGAVLLDAVKLLKPNALTSGTPWGLYAAGAVISFLVGIAALKLLIKMLSRQKFHWFAYYCLVAGVIVIGWQLVERR